MAELLAMIEAAERYRRARAELDAASRILEAGVVGLRREMSWSAIASALGVPVSTVRQWEQRGRAWNNKPPLEV